MKRLTIAQPLRLAAGLAIFSILASGCFQTAGAALQATNTPDGGISIVQALTPTATELPPPTAITPLPSLTPTVQQAIFGTASVTPAFPTETLPAQPTDFPTLTATSTETPTVATLGFNVTPTVTLLPTDTLTATPTNTRTITPTEPPIITPTRTSSATKPTAVKPSATKPVAVVQAATRVPDFAQQTLNALAAGIIQTSTKGAADQQTAISIQLGTLPAPDVNPNAPTPTPAPAAVATLAFPVSVSGTPQGTPGIAGSGAAGPITGNCLYTVVVGDRLFRIALRFNETPYQVAFANNLVNPDAIYPGQVIRIPNCTATPGPGTPTLVAPPVSVSANTGTGGALQPGQTSGKSYMVTDGDTLYGIATRNGVRVMALAQANNISNISLIYIGQTLVIP